MDFWEDAIKGSSALRAGLYRRLIDECTCALGLDTAAIYWDVEKFYDSISWAKLFEWALDLKFRPQLLLDDTGPTQRQNNTLNSGFFFSRNTLPMRRFWGALIKYHANIPQLADQVALNVMLSRSPGLRVARLDPMRFVNGFRFYEQNRSRGEPRRNASAVVLVHHNWIRGDAQKFARAVAYDTIPRAGEGRVHFLRRARHAIVRKEAWAPPLLLFGSQPPGLRCVLSLPHL